MDWRALFFSCAPLFSMMTGNPAEPDLFTQGVLCTHPSWGSFRIGYLGDWVYKQRFHDEFLLNGATYTQTVMKLSTYAALLTFNIKNRLDMYGIVGSSRMQIDHEIFTKRALGWGVGGKLLLFQHADFFLGTDVKYFATDQKPRYFVVDGLPFNIASNYRLKYHEIQAALGCSYQAWIFAPYINATYLLAHIEPVPAKLYVRFPDSPESVDIETKSMTNQKQWGLSLGLTLCDSKKASLAIEWRGINQNAIDVNGEIHF